MCIIMFESKQLKSFGSMQDPVCTPQEKVIHLIMSYYHSLSYFLQYFGMILYTHKP